MAPITEPCTLVYYVSKNGKNHVKEWLNSLDTTTNLILRRRLKRVISGNWGDCKQLEKSSGVWEFRISYGSGYRVYFARKNNTIIILLCGGSKKTQQKDIERAKNLWAECKDAL